MCLFLPNFISSGQPIFDMSKRSTERMVAGFPADKSVIKLLNRRPNGLTYSISTATHYIVYSTVQKDLLNLNL